MPSLETLDNKQREKMMRQTVKDVEAMLDNSEGYRRLLAITDEEWAEAEAEGEGEGATT